MRRGGGEEEKGGGEGENDVVVEMFVRGGSQCLRFGQNQRGMAATRTRRNSVMHNNTPRALTGI